MSVGVVDSTDLAQDRDRSRAPVNTIWAFRSHTMRGIPCYSRLKKGSPLWCLVFMWTKIRESLSSPRSEAGHSFTVAALRDHAPASVCTPHPRTTEDLHKVCYSKCCTNIKNPVWNVTPCDLVESALLSALQYYSAQKLEAAISSDTSVHFYQITRHIEEDVTDHTL
jgi:hypothetical protein